MMKTMVFLVDKRINSKISFLKHLKKHSMRKILVIEKGFEEAGGVPEGYFDEMYVVSDITNYNELEALFVTISEKVNIDVVIATSENIIEAAGRLRTKFGIKGMQRNQAEAVRNKWVMKEMIRQFGIPAPITKIASTKRDMKQLALEIGFPLIVKPIAGWATIKTYKIKSNADLDCFLQNEWTNEPVLVEQFVTGKEFHIDSVVSNAEVVFSSVSEYLFNCLDVVENNKPLGSICYPEIAESGVIEQLKTMNSLVIKALGITNAVCHAELFLLPDGDIYFGEIAARIGGISVIPPIVLNTHGIDLFKAAIEVELGEYKMEDRSNSAKFTGMICLPAAEGKVLEISALEDFSHIEGIIQIHIPVKKGQRVSSGKDTMTRSGFAIVEGSTFENVKKNMLEIFNTFHITVESEKTPFTIR